MGQLREIRDGPSMISGSIYIKMENYKNESKCQQCIINGRLQEKEVKNQF